MADLLGTSLAVFLSLTMILMGAAALMTGHALAGAWRPVWQVVPAALGLTFVDRFLTNALFAGDFLSPSGALIDGVVLLAFTALGHRLTLVRQMVRQYPWDYERVGPLGYRRKRALP